MTFYFYDLETSGVNPREQRVMQFAGQRTNDKLEPIGEVDNILIALTEDVLPDPWAILTHKITPQRTLEQGMNEADFLRWFHKHVVKPDTIFTGYNSIRFDDEFMRYMHYRNFYDAYEWQWKDGRSKWDLMDVLRMTRALRPKGIQWPFTSDGKPSVKLELLTAVNKISHKGAHTADSDVRATIELARLVRDKQPKLFDYLLNMRDKNSVAKLVNGGEPFVYSSGRYPSEFHKTTVAISIGAHPEQSGSLLVYDLRNDPDDFASLSAVELTERIFVPRDSDLLKLPVKPLALNRCPAVAPLGVLNEAAQQNIQIDLNVCEKNLKKLISSDLPFKIIEAFSLQHKARQTALMADSQLVDGQLYEGFFNDADKREMAHIRLADTATLSDLHPAFIDDRLNELIVLYKARNYPSVLNPEDRVRWEAFVKNKFYAGKPSRVEIFSQNLAKAAESVSNSTEDNYLLSELQLFVEANLPSAD